nr:hydroxyproline O-galactosyltransferase GALT3-like [Ipomoea batatas]
MLGRQSLLASLSLLAMLLLVFLILFSTNSNSPLRTPNDEIAAINNLVPADSHARFTLLIGIFTRPEKYERRHFLRLIYGVQSTSLARVDVKFILCNLSGEEQRAFVALEILRFRDVVILNCTENMNSGKTHTYFSSLPGILPFRYDYVMKADDDVFLRLAPLAASLEGLPRRDLYYGFVIPCPSMNPFVSYMSGMGFVLSWDLVEWIGRSRIAANNTFGPEDKLVGQWLDMGKKAKNRFNNKPAMYDYPGTNGRCSHELIPETIAVHRLKKWEQWKQVECNPGGLVFSNGKVENLVEKSEEMTCELGLHTFNWVKGDGGQCRSGAHGGSLPCTSVTCRHTSVLYCLVYTRRQRGAREPTQLHQKLSMKRSFV